jgi:hypothetical protein
MESLKEGRSNEVSKNSSTLFDFSISQFINLGNNNSMHRQGILDQVCLLKTSCCLLCVKSLVNSQNIQKNFHNDKTCFLFQPPKGDDVLKCLCKCFYM